MKYYLAALLAVSVALADLKVPPVELRDQFDSPQKLSFPAARLTILTIADRKGSDQVDDWITALKPRYGERVDFRGIAEVAAVPSFLQGHVRRKFQDVRKYPVMMDWSGEVCKKFDAVKAVANILVISRDGVVLERCHGKATPEGVARLCAVLDKTLVDRE